MDVLIKSGEHTGLYGKLGEKIIEGDRVYFLVKPENSLSAIERVQGVIVEASDMAAIDLVAIKNLVTALREAAAKRGGKLSWALPCENFIEFTLKKYSNEEVRFTLHHFNGIPVEWSVKPLQGVTFEGEPLDELAETSVYKTAAEVIESL